MERSDIRGNHCRLLKGQVHGGIAQGVGQALGEAMVYDGNGQLLSGSFMDYQMPRAEDFPYIAVGSHDVPTKSNPLGVKGAGEAGCVGALPAVMNAVNDALLPLGIRHFEMPATPARVWKAIREAKGGAECGIVGWVEHRETHHKLGLDTR
jgi:carbon-monoxide dehydrogenase large subunit